MEVESDNKLEFLDTVIFKSPNSTFSHISSKVKKTDKGLFYHFSSFIPDRYKLNHVFTLVYNRIYRIASSMSIFHTDVTSLRSRLQHNVFSSHFIDRCIERVLKPGVLQRQLVIALPYLGPISIVRRRNILRLVQKFYPAVNLRVVFRRGFEISNLFNYKDKFPLGISTCKSMVVYYISCRNCRPSQAYKLAKLSIQ